MLRIGIPSYGLGHNTTSDWRPMRRRWYATGRYGYVDISEWKRISYFENFDKMQVFPKGCSGVYDSHKDKVMEFSGGMSICEYNLLDMNKRDWMRVLFKFNSEEPYKIYGFFDVVRYHFYNLVAKTLNCYGWLDWKIWKKYRLKKAESHPYNLSC